jgi:hypothetical protein
MYRQNIDGSTAVHRYGLDRQIKNGDGFKHQRGYGSLDICDECIERVAGRNRRPELVGKTGPKR